MVGPRTFVAHRSTGVAVPADRAGAADRSGVVLAESAEVEVPADRAVVADMSRAVAGRAAVELVA